MTPEETRKAYYSLPSAMRKELAEMTAFIRFTAAASLNVDSGTPKNEKPPLPDISCSIGGAPYLFELGEITDEELAADVSTSLRTGVDGAGGFFSEEVLLIRIIRKKAASTYETNGAPLDLILQYDKQYPLPRLTT
jgi:hypothetical protein